MRAEADGVADVAHIKHQDIDEVRTLGGQVLGDEERVLVGGSKLVPLDGMAVLMVQPSERRYSAVDGGRSKALRSF